ncbi:MAG TPA: hypothetical protein HPP94_05870 [Desulfuromonadales bacterium]|nr:hypothetical protein [Desulfuromonadales bacterium]
MFYFISFDNVDMVGIRHGVTTFSSRVVRKMSLYTLKYCIFTVCFLFATSGCALAAGQMDVTRLDALYLDRFINFTVEWQSLNPVLKVVISAGRETKEVAVDEFDNHRNPGGYQGAVTVQLQAEQHYSQNGIPYVVQLEDELRQKSAAFSGKVSVTPAAGSAFAGSQPVRSDDNWGRENLKTGMALGPQPSGVARAGDMIDKLLVVMDRIDIAPSIGALKVNVMGPESVTFSTKATDDKGLREVKFRVFDSRGMLVGLQSLNGLGKVWEGTSQSFDLGGGTFRVIAQAVDSAGNTSKEQSASCVLKGAPRELAQIQELQNSMPAATDQQPSAALPPQEDPSVFDQPLMLQESPPPSDQSSPYQQSVPLDPSQPSQYQVPPQQYQQPPPVTYPTQSSPYQQSIPPDPSQPSQYHVPPQQYQQPPPVTYPTQSSPYQQSVPPDPSQPSQYQVPTQQYQQPVQ